MFISLPFLYGLSLLLMTVYSLRYYNRLYKKGRYMRPGWFMGLFGLVSLFCMGFLWVHFNAPLSLQTYSNLDHHFLQHQGFVVSKNIELGNSDTVHFNNNAYNRFIIQKQGEQVQITSPYSEDPLYGKKPDEGYSLLSPTWPVNSELKLQADTITCTIRVRDGQFEITDHRGNTYQVNKTLKRGASIWTLFKNEAHFVDAPYYTHEKLRNSLQHIYLLRQELAGEDGALAYFISGRAFEFARLISHNNTALTPAALAFETSLPTNSQLAWGIGFRENNRNQYRLQTAGGDTCIITNQFPVSYPLTEEKKDWNSNTVNKFLVANSQDLLDASFLVNEGFLFNSAGENRSYHFKPVMLSYRKGDGRTPLQLKARRLDRVPPDIPVVNNQLLLPAASGQFQWLFQVTDSFNWQFSNAPDSNNWQLSMIGMLIVFSVLVLLSAAVNAPNENHLIWQLLSCVTMLLLTTRLLLYWRYKSFPPFDAMDLPSQEQLMNVWNYRIILYTGYLLAVIFGFRGLYNAFVKARKFISRSLRLRWRDMGGVPALSFQNKMGRRFAVEYFLLGWFMVLVIGFVLTRVADSYVRQLCMGMILGYFVFLFASYKHSPLVTAAGDAWWRIDSHKKISLLISNPVKVILSLSLLVVLLFIDIGLAIIFFNFLLFHETWLCYNYAIAGLSAGKRGNSRLFFIAGTIYLLAFAGNLFFIPGILQGYLRWPGWLFAIPPAVCCLGVALALFAIRFHASFLQKMVRVVAVLLVAIPFFVPKTAILEKAMATRYRIDVLTMPVDQVIEQAYMEGNNSTPVIRAAQNQWFINTFVHQPNNPHVNDWNFHMLPHAPQNRGAKYNAQATDLVASRFMIAEHGKWSVLFYILLWLVPATLAAAFYRIYPDFTKSTNHHYPGISTGFSVLNYIFITGLLVVLAASGKYIFFGQDLPFASILSKLSVLFPAVLILLALRLFRHIPLQLYANNMKRWPAVAAFAVLALSLLFVAPTQNRSKEFGLNDLVQKVGLFATTQMQPVLSYYDTARATRRLPIQAKDQLLKDSLNRMLANSHFADSNRFLQKIVWDFAHGTFSDHINAANILYLHNTTGALALAVNENYFRIQPPPHLQHYWTGSVYGDSSVYNIYTMHEDGSFEKSVFSSAPRSVVWHDVQLAFDGRQLFLHNRRTTALSVRQNGNYITIPPNDSLPVSNPSRLLIKDMQQGFDQAISIEPDAFMRNCFVNGNRYYAYPLQDKFTWARNFSETIAGAYTREDLNAKNVFLSLDYTITNDLVAMMQEALQADKEYTTGAEYGVSIADGEGRLLAIADYIKGRPRPDPNDKAAYNDMLQNEGNELPQQEFRKQAGNINLLRLNPGPGSTLKPIVFAAIASQLPLNWQQMSSTGFEEKLPYFGGERVAPYNFEKNNGAIKSVADYLRLSDNYLHSNIMLLGSYPKQPVGELLHHFTTSYPGNTSAWPRFTYNGTSYWLNGYKNWPGFEKGRVNFGSDSSFLSIGLLSNFNILNRHRKGYYELFAHAYDSSLFLDTYNNSGFVLPEMSLFDQQGDGIDTRIPYDAFAYCFRNHVKGSSQVMIPPVKMVEAFGKLVSLNSAYSLTLNPAGKLTGHKPFYTDASVSGFNNLMQEQVFLGMHQALFQGTAGALGRLLKNGDPYFYYAKTGTTGDDATDTKSRLLVLVISKKEIHHPNTSLDDNRFYTIYFTSQNGPNKQYEALQQKIIAYLQESKAFKQYMGEEESVRK